MKYVFLIYENTELWSQAAEEKTGACFEHHLALQGGLEPGVMSGTFALAEIADAQIVRKSGERQVVVDGPFAETKEVLLGVYICDFDSLEAAIEFGRAIPLVGDGTVEVRPALWADPEMGLSMASDD